MNYYILTYLVNNKLLQLHNEKRCISIGAETKVEAKVKGEKLLKEHGYELLKLISITKLSKKN